MDPPQSSQVKTVRQVEYPFRFQRTDRWLPVYTWLESLDTDEVVNSNDIADWLSTNPKICEHLCTRHSRYHLTHYIKKCHAKILKRQNKLKVVPPKAAVAGPKNVHYVHPPTPVSMLSNELVNIPKDSDLFEMKRKEALRKYELLLEFEKELATVIQNPLIAGNAIES